MENGDRSPSDRLRDRRWSKATCYSVRDPSTPTHQKRCVSGRDDIKGLPMNSNKCNRMMALSFCHSDRAYRRRRSASGGISLTFFYENTRGTPPERR
jgi:hypothetical protein